MLHFAERFRARARQRCGEIFQNDRVMNDYRYIRGARSNYRKARPADTIAQHRPSRMAARAAGGAVRWRDGCRHSSCHAPGRAPPPGAPLPWCYASNLTDLIRKGQPAEWYFGHTHHPTEIMVGKTRIVNVSAGYPS